jgi:hypothetical protein
MINPLHILGILSLLAGWHLDAIDDALIERHRARLAPLNQSADTPPLIDTNGHGRYWIAQQ